MQYKIPQDVQIEDKIVGPLTLKQLIILGAGGGLTYAIYTILARSYYIEVWLLPTAIPGILTLAVTFLKIGGIPFGKWCFLMVEYFFKPKKRVFVMGGADNYMVTLFADKTKKAQTTGETSTKAERDRERLSKIGEISKALDTYSSTPHPAA
jgi:PrgI family protein